MLAKKPEDRYQTPAEVIKALAEWLPQRGRNGCRPLSAIQNLARSEQITFSEVINGSTKRLASKNGSMQNGREGPNEKMVLARSCRRRAHLVRWHCRCGLSHVSKRSPRNKSRWRG